MYVNDPEAPTVAVMSTNAREAGACTVASVAPCAIRLGRCASTATKSTPLALTVGTAIVATKSTSYGASTRRPSRLTAAAAVRAPPASRRQSPAAAQKPSTWEAPESAARSSSVKARVSGSKTPTAGSSNGVK